MSKLLSEPRVIKEIKDVSPKKRVKKKSADEKVNVKYTVFFEGGKTDVDELFRVYSEDPFKARVKFFNKGRGFFGFCRLVLFEFDNGDFEICKFQNSFGISTTNKIYSSQRKDASIIYRKKKFWHRQNKNIQPLTYGNLRNFINNYENIYVLGNESGKIKKSKIYQYFDSRFHWFKTVGESKISFGLTFNKISENKIFKLKDMTWASLGVNYKLGQMIAESETFRHIINDTGKSIKAWKEILKVLDGVEHLTKEILNSNYFYDTCKMAKTLGRKVNCRWGLKRLKEEHDIWAKEITRIVLECELEYDLNIRPIYKSFAEYSGFNLLKTNKDMLAEGMIQNHCVGTYINSVERGRCAIYHVDGYTLELSHVTESFKVKESFEGGVPEYRNVEKKVLKNVQFRGKYNVEAPKELNDKVNKMLIDFMVSKEMELAEERDKTYLVSYGNNNYHQINEVEQVNDIFADF